MERASLKNYDNNGGWDDVVNCIIFYCCFYFSIIVFNIIIFHTAKASSKPRNKKEASKPPLNLKNIIMKRDLSMLPVYLSKAKNGK